MSKRTIREFTVSSNAWPIVEAWAKESRYQLIESNQSTRLYKSKASQKGGMVISPIMLKITHTTNHMRIEAWIKMGFLHRMTLFFLLPSEMGIDPGGLRAVEARRLGRNAINKLLERFGQPPIK